MPVSPVNIWPNVLLSAVSVITPTGPATTIGNTLFVMTTTNDAPGCTVTAGGVTTWNHGANISSSQSADIWYGTCTSSATSVTVTDTTGANYPGAAVVEMPGTYTFNAGSGLNSASASVCPGPARTVAVGDVVFAMIEAPAQVASPYSAGAGWTACGQGYFSSGAAAYGCANYIVATSSGSVTPSWTQGSTTAYNAVTASFTPNAGPALTAPGPIPRLRMPVLRASVF